MATPLPVLVYGKLVFPIEPPRITTRPDGLDQMRWKWQTDRSDTFSKGGSPPDFPNMRIQECETVEEIPDVAYEHMLQCVGLATGEASRRLAAEDEVEPTEEGWDTGRIVYVTRTPTAFLRGHVHPEEANLYCVAAPRQRISGQWWRVTCAYKGKVGTDGVVKRRITINNATVENTFTNPEGVLGWVDSWTDTRLGKGDTSMPVVVDTFISDTAPPTDMIPGPSTPSDAPPVSDVWTVGVWSGSGWRYNWPKGWKYSSLQAERLLPGVNLWLITLSYEYKSIAEPA